MAINNFPAMWADLETDLKKEARDIDFGKINLTVEIRKKKPFRYVVSRERSHFVNDEEARNER